MKPLEHTHSVEVKLSPDLQRKVDTAREHLEENKKPYLFGFGGVVIGVIATRLFARPQINQTIIVEAMKPE